MRLDVACSNIVDCEHKTAPIDDDGEYFAVGTPAMRDHRINYAEARRISRGTFEAWTRRLAPRAGDLLFAREAPVGPIVRLPDAANVAPGQRTVLLRPDPAVADSAFLYYALTAPTAQAGLIVKAEGSTVHHLNVPDIRSFEVWVPPLAQQQAIAEVLGALDDKIAANTALAVTARGLGVAMLQVDAPTTALGNVVLHHKRQVNPASVEDEAVEHYSLPAFDGGDGPEIVMPDSIKSNKFMVSTPAVLVSKLNPQTPRVWPINAGAARPRLASTEFLVLEPFVTDPWVMWALLSQPSFAVALQGKVAGTSGSHQRVRPEEVLATSILDPRSIRPQLLADVGEVLAPIDVLLAENRTLAATRDALLPQLMSDKLRVREAEAIASDAGV